MCLCGLPVHVFMIVGLWRYPFAFKGDIMTYSMSSWHHYTILHPHLVVAAQWQQLYVMRNLLKKLMVNPNGVHKFIICSIFVRFWSHWICFSPIMSYNHCYFCFHENEKMMSPSSCMILPFYVEVAAKVVVVTSTLPHCNRSLGCDHHILPFVDARAEV